MPPRYIASRDRPRYPARIGSADVAPLLTSDLVTELALDVEASRRIGVLAAAASGARDVVDGRVAIIALDRDAVVLSSNPDDIARWGVPAANIVPC